MSQLTRKLISIFLLIIILLTFSFAVQKAFAGTHLYFSGERTYGQLGIAVYVANLKGGQTQTNGFHSSFRAHNKTWINPYFSYEAIGVGDYVELHHSEQPNKQNNCFWTNMLGYLSGALEVECHYYD